MRPRTAAHPPIHPRTHPPPCLRMTLDWTFGYHTGQPAVLLWQLLGSAMLLLFPAITYTLQERALAGRLHLTLPKVLNVGLLVAALFSILELGSLLVTSGVEKVRWCSGGERGGGQWANQTGLSGRVAYQVLTREALSVQWLAHLMGFSLPLLLRSRAGCSPSCSLTGCWCCWPPSWA